MSQQSPLAPNWRQYTNQNGQIFYHNTATSVSQWEYPVVETDEKQGSEAIDLFNELLRTVFSTQLDMHTSRHHHTGQGVMSMDLELQKKILNCLKDNSFFYTLRDKNNLTILGYIILTNKPSMMAYYIEYLNRKMTDIEKSHRIKKMVGDKLNEELEFILTHRVNGEVDVAAQIMQVMNAITRNIMIDLFQTFTLSQRNVELLGYLMLMVNYPVFNLSDSRATFSIPDNFAWGPPPPSLGGKFKKKYKLSRRNKLYKRKGSRKHYSRRRGHRGGAMTTLNSAKF